VFYKILQPKIEDLALEVDQFKEEKEELTSQIADLKLKINEI
jgi:prefoldin subunit 5